MLHDEYAAVLAWDLAEPEQFENAETCDFVANVLVYTHAQHSKRENRGLKVKIKRVGKLIKRLALRKKVKEFFKRMRKPSNSVIDDIDKE